ncbi:hypothetical protein ACWDUN_08150 [Mycobacterium sp. NPDC003323]
MKTIAKLAILGATVGGMSIAGAATAVAEPKTVNMTTVSTDAPFDDFDDYVRGEIHQHIAGWPGWHHNWHPGEWRDDDWNDDWDDDGWDD